MNYTVQEALDIVENFDYSEKEMFLEILEKRKIEDRRQEILLNAENTFSAIKDNKHKEGNLTDLLIDLDA